MYSADRKYTHDHLWISLEGSHGTVGITDHAKKNLCPLTAVELPEVGRSLSRQEAFGTLEAAKALSEMFAPVSGKVVAVNTDLSAHPELLCDDPNGTWIIKLEIADLAEGSSLLSSAQYAQAVPLRRVPVNGSRNLRRRSARRSSNHSPQPNHNQRQSRPRRRLPVTT
jgi:glycine cleavage system H protein